MLTRQRKTLILARLKSDGQVVAKAFAQEAGLSEDTIRRDLRELAAEGLLQRVHGGALPSSPALAEFSERQGIATAGKIAIGRAAAAMVRPRQFVFLDGGTTTSQMARHLPLDLKATVVTHSPSIAVELVNHPNVTVELIGGRLFKHSVVSVGVAAMEAIRKIRPDAYFMGVTGIHEDYGLTTGDPEEAAIKRAICQLAAETIVLASSEKLGAVSPCLVAPLSDISTVLAEGRVPPKLEARLRKLKIGIVHA
jgi:DeoR/GlpR family transcriptional regulator of sugar metabolism